MKVTKLLTVVALICWFSTYNFTAPAFAQAQKKPAEQESVVKLKTNLISVRVVVTDKQGGLIDTLKKEDFEVLEDNHPQNLSFFSLEKIGDATNQKPTLTPPTSDKTDDKKSLASLSSAPIARTLVLFVDTAHLAYGSTALLKDNLRKFIDKQITEQDLVALITTNGSLGVFEQFTQNKQVLLHAVEKITPWRGEVKKSLFTPYLASMVLMENREAVALAMSLYKAERGIPAGTPLYRSSSGAVSVAPVLKGEAKMILRQATIKREATLSTLKAITERLAEMPGQRMLALFSDGFTMFTDSGNNDTAEVKAITSKAARSGVVIYSFDTKGLVDPAFVDAAYGNFVPSPALSSFMTAGARESEDGMNALAVDTGGKAIFGTNGLTGGLQKVLDENRVYYALDYYSSNDLQDNKFRRLTVRVKNHPDYIVRAQKGYLPIAAKKEESLTAPQRLIQAMKAALPVQDVGVAAVADYFESEGNDTPIALQVYVDANTVDFVEQDKSFVFDVEIGMVIFDETGKVAQTFNETTKGKLLPEQLEVVKQNGLKYVKRMALKPGFYQARVGLLDNRTEKIGTANSWIEVPNLEKGKLTLSSLLLSNSAPGEEKKESANLSQSAWKKGVKFFTNKEHLVYLLKVYNFSAESNLTMQTEILQGEKRIYQSQWLPVSASLLRKDKMGLELLREFQLNKMPAGIYELKVTLKDSKTNQTMQADALFGVER